MFTNRFRQIRQSFLLLLPALMLTGCRNMTHTERGLLAGAGLGGVAGGLIGKATGNTGAGIAAGTVLGGIAGGLHGDSIDEVERRTDAKIAAATATPPPVRQGPVTVHDVIDMTNNGVTDATIVNQIRTTGARFQLSNHAVIQLTQHGVSQRVIQEMQSTSRAPVREVAPSRTVIYERPVYVPRPGIGVGIGYHSHRRRFCR